MALTVRTVEYFYARVANDPDKAYALLAQLAAEEITLLSFSAVPFGANHLELTLFPDRGDSLVRAAQKLGLNLTGPQHAVLVQGDDRLGALADIHKCLSEAGVRIYASTGVTDGAGHFGYLIYFSEGDHLEAARALAAAAIKT
jgi:predicted amino acid-binding ACT domain protein